MCAALTGGVEGVADCGTEPPLLLDVALHAAVATATNDRVSAPLSIVRIVDTMRIVGAAWELAHDDSVTATSGAVAPLCCYPAVMSTQAAPRPLRSDASRNRERIVASARRLFAARGADLSVDEITRDAGVGMGTLYRHFANKDDLLDAVLEDAFSEWTAAARHALAEPDAWRGFCEYLEQALALHVANRALKDVLAGRDGSRPRVEALRARIRPLLVELIARAKQQGALREDFVLEDMPLVFWSCDRVIDATADVSPDIWRRHLGILLDGLRADAATPLAVGPMTRAQVKRIARSRR